MTGPKQSDRHQQRTITEMRDEFERELLRSDRAQVRPRAWGFSNPLARLPRRLLPVFAVAALAGGGAGIAVAGGDVDQPSVQPPAELISVTSASGQKIDFKCEADRQWFFDQVGGMDSPVIKDPNSTEPWPTPPDGICKGSPSIP